MERALGVPREQSDTHGLAINQGSCVIVGGQHKWNATHARALRKEAKMQGCRDLIDELDRLYTPAGPATRAP